MTATALDQYADRVVLDTELCRRAAASRDPRFDGRFLVGVHTTGVYCRPHCPGTPKPENISYFAGPEQARAAGLRACLRCRPDAASWRSGSRPAARRRRDRTLELPYEPPLDWEGMLRFLTARAVTGVEEIVGGMLRRSVPTPDGPVVVEVALASPGHLRLALRCGDSSAAPTGPLADDIVARARRAFDLEASPAAIARDLAGDPLLAPLLARRPGLRMPGAWDGFEIAVRAVLGQQVSVQAARTLAGRLVQRFGRPLLAPVGAVTHAFPEPADLAGAPVHEIGLPRARAETIRELAAAALDGRIDLGRRCSEVLTVQLQALRGIGPWTAAYVAMRALGDPDALPAGDLGVRQALARDGALPDVREVERIAECWRPWRAYAVAHLWASLGEREGAAVAQTTAARASAAAVA